MEPEGAAQQSKKAQAQPKPKGAVPPPKKARAIQSPEKKSWSLQGPPSTHPPTSPISRQLVDAMPGPTSIRELCQPAVFLFKSLCKNMGADFVAMQMDTLHWELHTACSGLGCPEIAAEVIQAAIPKLGPQFARVTMTVKHGIKIDKNDAAQAVLQANCLGQCRFKHLEDWVFGHARGFEKIRLKEACHCLEHDKECKLPSNASRVFAGSDESGKAFVVMVAGPPCNPWSKRGSRKGNKHSDAFAHVVWAKIVVTGPYDIVIFENVLDEELIKNLHKHFAQHFDILVSVVSARTLGYPVTRERMYALLLRKGKCKWSSDLTLQGVLDIMQHRCAMEVEQLWFLDSSGLEEHGAWNRQLSRLENLTPA